MTRNPTRRDVLATTAGLAAAGLAGCAGAASSGDSDTRSGSSPTHHDHEGHSHDEITGPHDSAEVRMLTTDAGKHFDPHVVWVKAGGTVTWVNESGSHTTTAYAPANDKPRRVPHDAAVWDSGILTEQGATLEHTFQTPGVYDYYCVPHEGGGMVGTVIVGKPDLHDQPGLAKPRESLPKAAREKISKLNKRVTEVLGHHDGGHDGGTKTGHHDGGHDGGTKTGHHDDGHHDGTATETAHHDDGHHDGTETGHHGDG